MKKTKLGLNKKMLLNKEVIAPLTAQELMKLQAGANNTDGSGTNKDTICQQWPPAASVCTHWPTNAG